MPQDNNQTQRSGGGMDENKQRENASKGSKATHQGGSANEPNPGAGGKGAGGNQNQGGEENSY